MLIVDVFVANLWMPFLLFGAGIRKKIDSWLRADASAVDKLQNKVEQLQAKSARIPSFPDLMVVLAIAFGGVALSHLVADSCLGIPVRMDDPSTRRRPRFKTHLHLLHHQGFFWLVVVATAIGIALSFQVKSYEGAGASKIGSVFLYILVATIRKKMDIGSLIDNWSMYGSAVTIGLLWMLVHIVVLARGGQIDSSPILFVAVGSQANVGGAASAPIVASAFSCPRAKLCPARRSWLCGGHRRRHRLHGVDARHLDVGQERLSFLQPFWIGGRPNCVVRLHLKWNDLQHVDAKTPQRLRFVRIVRQ